MAWIVKNSATMQIERREDPYLDDELKKMLETEVIPRFPSRQAATLPVLHAVQHKHSWIPYQALEEAAEFLETSASQLLDTASFYDDFWLNPKGRYLIMMCQSVSCELLGQMDLLESIKAKLQIEPGQTTEDGKFTLMTVGCLGSCDTAPCALVNETLHENLTTENFGQILDGLE
ncbi:MAG: NADH-quinone oxidoreductase subunit NuoE [Phycisphaeraceae bacterium]|nr:NADH-quinone oxidoreductase subunit NuoE [Phycisphaeraceae bacterium]|tara:strand:- start:5852 stop:6376 length:525 start_codon:yes stop_codon:yes gene_type:complete